MLLSLQRKFQETIMATIRTSRLRIGRRSLLRGAGAFWSTAAAGTICHPLPAPPGAAQTSPAPPAVATSDKDRPQIPYGVMTGDPTTGSAAGGRAIIWSKTDRPARMLVEYATREDFRNARQVAGPAALAVSDYTARLDLGDLPAGADIFYRVTFQDLPDLKTLRAPATGPPRAPAGPRPTTTLPHPPAAPAHGCH